MSSKRGIRRKSCVGKVRHLSLNDAWNAAKALHRAGRSTWLLPYKCQFCGFYHVGHSPKKVKQALRSKGLR